LGLPVIILVFEHGPQLFSLGIQIENSKTKLTIDPHLSVLSVQHLAPEFYKDGYFSEIVSHGLRQDVDATLEVTEAQLLTLHGEVKVSPSVSCV
jgi:hypothetical protein